MLAFTSTEDSTDALTAETGSALLLAFVSETTKRLIQCICTPDGDTELWRPPSPGMYSMPPGARMTLTFGALIPRSKEKYEMKVEDSGMPEEAYWNSLFNIEGIVDWLEIPEKSKVVEIGSGYGTFTVPIAGIGKECAVVTFDIEPSMVETTKRNLAKAGLSNVECILRDVLTEGTGLESASVDLVLLFNILHFNKRRLLLQEASRILKKGGVVAIIHWRKDVPTPRGPAIELRPDIAQIMSASEGLELNYRGNSKVLEPYHWGIQLVKGD